MALIVTLGILTVVTFAVFAFVVTMRTEHLAARNTLQRTQARQYVDIGIAHSMGIIDFVLVLVGSRSCYPVQGWFATTSAQSFHFEQNDCLGGFPEMTNGWASLFNGSVSNLLPSILAGQAASVQSGWINIVETNGQAVVSDGVRVGRVAFLIANLSGLPDVHGLTAHQRQLLGDALTATAAAPLDANTGVYHRVYLTQPDLHAANNGPVSNLVVFSYDPNPDVFFTTTNQFPELGTRDFAGVLTNRFNINATNQLDGYISRVSDLLTGAGVTRNPDQVAYNILNYIEPGRIPIVKPADSPAYRTDYGVKDVPLINEIVLSQVTNSATPKYHVNVELWYPFVPRESPPRTRLWVGVYTADPGNAGPSPTLPALGFVIDPVPGMNYGTAAEFYVADGAAHPIEFLEPIGAPPVQTPVPIDANHRVWIWPRVLIDDVCVDEALVTGGSVLSWDRTGCIQFADPRANHMAPSIENLASATLGTTNTNSTVRVPWVLTGEPMRSAGELRHIYAPGLTNDCLDLASPVGAACRDRFTVRDTNTPVRGLIQANTQYTNVWQALLSEVSVGWTNRVFADTRKKLSENPNPNLLPTLASLTADSLLDTGGRGWTCFREMLPQVATNLASAIVMSNATYDVRGDILAGIADRVSFRQNAFLVVVCGQRLSPHGRVLADQRAAAVILRDAFTGRWVVQQMYWLTQ